MKIKTLEFKKNNHIPLGEIVMKYSTKGKIISEPIKFEGDELKSIISLLFTINYHYPKITEENINEANNIKFENNILFGSTREFGRQMIENIEGFNKVWLHILESKTYQLDNILNDNDLLDFVEMALLDYMHIRNVEYGKFFINDFSKSVLDFFQINNNSFMIKNALENDEDYLKKIGEKIIQANPRLETYEALLLVFVIKENFLKSKTTVYDYFLTSTIAKNHIYKLSLKTNVLKNTLNDSMTLRWNNKGKGGPRL